MAEPRFLHLAVANPTPLPPAKREEIETVLNKAKDWLRYAPNCWLVWTAVGTGLWAERLRAVLADKDNAFLILEVKLQDYSGWLMDDAWKWINKERK